MENVQNFEKYFLQKTFIKMLNITTYLFDQSRVDNTILQFFPSVAPIISVINEEMIKEQYESSIPTLYLPI